MEKLKPLFSSQRADWRTPGPFFQWLDERFRFDLDVDWKIPIKRGWPKGKDALTNEWPGKSCLYCNPPYGREISRWLSQGLDASKRGSTVVFLLPARTDTRWFHEYAPKGEVWFFQGRLRFQDGQQTSKAGAPFPSMLLVFGRGVSEVGYLTLPREVRG